MGIAARCILGMGVFRIGAGSGIWACCLMFPAQALTLTEAYQAALLNDPYFKSEMSAAQAGMEEYSLGLSGFLPELTFNARKMDNQLHRDNFTNTNVLISTDQRNYQSFGAGLYLRQPLFNLEKFSEFQKGKLQAEGAQAQMEMGRQNAVLRVTGIYLDAIIAGYQAEYAAAKKKLAEAQTEQAVMYRSKGEATAADEQTVQARLELAAIQENEASDDRLTKVSILSQLIARDVAWLPEMVFDASQLGTENELPMTLDKWTELAVAHNPELIQKRQAVELAENETKKNMSSYMPTVDLVANATRNNQDSLAILNQDIRNQGIGIELNWQLFKGGYFNASIRQARARAEQARQDAAAAQLRLKVEVEHQYRGALTGRMKLNALSLAIKANEERIKSAELLFKAGVRTSVDVLSAQVDWYQIRKDYSDALKEFVLACLKLRALTGSLGDEDVARMEKYLRAGMAH